MRQLNKIIVMAVVLAFVAMCRDAGAVQISYVLQGVGSGQINNVPFTNQPFTFTMLAPTDNVVTGPFWLAVNNDSVALQIGATNYTGFAGSSYDFPQTNFPSSAQFVFVQALVGTDWDIGQLSAYNLAFTTYDMKSEIGPLSIPSTAQSPFTLFFQANNNVNIGIQTTSQVTFQATFVPEPSALILGTIASGILASGRHRRKSVPHNRV